MLLTPRSSRPCLLPSFSVLVALAACAAPSPTLGPPPDRELVAVQARDAATAPPRLTALAPGIWLHTSEKTVPPYGSIASNGLVVARGERGAVLVDTAWTDAQTAALLALIEEELGRPVTAAVVTHAHDDKMGGVAALHAAGVATFAHPVSNALAPSRGLTAARGDLRFSAAGEADEPPALGGLTVFYPGPGHTADNIVVLAEGAGVLFGGCLIRPGGAASIGNTSDADLSHWDAAAETVARRFPRASVVVPSHGAPGGRTLLAHTAALAREARADQSAR